MSDTEKNLELPKDPQELFALAKENGVELTDEQMEQVSGGEDWDMLVTKKCDKCGTEVTVNVKVNSAAQCPTCGNWVRVHFPM